MKLGQHEVQGLDGHMMQGREGRRRAGLGVGEEMMRDDDVEGVLRRAEGKQEIDHGEEDRQGWMPPCAALLLRLEPVHRPVANAMLLQQQG